MSSFFSVFSAANSSSNISEPIKPKSINPPPNTIVTNNTRPITPPPPSSSAISIPTSPPPSPTHSVATKSVSSKKSKFRFSGDLELQLPFDKTPLAKPSSSFRDPNSWYESTKQAAAKSHTSSINPTLYPSDSSQPTSPSDHSSIVVSVENNLDNISPSYSTSGRVRYLNDRGEDPKKITYPSQSFRSSLRSSVQYLWNKSNDRSRG